MGSYGTHVANAAQFFNGLEAEHRATKMLIARVEPTLPAMSLTTNKLKLAERVGFEPDRTL